MARCAGWPRGNGKQNDTITTRCAGCACGLESRNTLYSKLLYCNTLELFSRNRLTFAYASPTFNGMKRKHTSKPGAVSVGNVTVKIYKRQRRTMLGKWRKVFEVAD